MADFPFLFAISWLQLAIFIIFIVIPLLSQVLGGTEEAKQARRKQQQPRRQPPPKPLRGAPEQGGAPPKGAQPQGGGRSALEAEIKEFLNRAQGSKQRQQPAQKAQPRQKKPAAMPIPRDLTRADSGMQTAPREREFGRGVGDHVRDHIESDSIGEHAEQLGRGISQADENLEGHLHDVFDHQLGKLSRQSTQQPAAQGTDSEVWESSVEQRERSDAAQRDRIESIVGMLRDPDSLQQAIILSEILRRPE